jgi:hypothetical protein
MGSFIEVFLALQSRDVEQNTRPITPLLAIGSIEHFCRPPIVVFAS